MSPISHTVVLDGKSNAEIHKHYKFLRVIGHGQFGVIRAAVAKKNKSGQKFAVKSIPKAKISVDLKMMLRELEILESVDHPNIIKLYETYEDSLYLHMVMELCTGGNMLERIAQTGTHSEHEAADKLGKLCLAVNHLHELYICHRDIKPENCMYVSEDSSAEIKLIDFGLSNKFGSTDIERMYSFVGTPYYMAPEVPRGNYSKECDIWSLGVFLYKLLSGRQAFASSNLKELYSKIKAGEYSFEGEEWAEISDEAKDLISKMLVVAPNKRLTLKKVLRHSWFKVHRSSASRTVPVGIIHSLRRKSAWSYFQKESMRIILKYLSSVEIESLKVLST
jgi:calcium-dependent protein kinase